MKQWKILVIAVLVSVCVNLWAAPHAVVNRYVDDFMIRLKIKTSLTAEQTQALSNILYDGINEREDIIASYEGETGLLSMRSMRKELQAVNDVINARARELLDEKQYAAFQEIQKENAERLKKRLQERGQHREEEDNEDDAE